ncbi:MAG: hypothetical protein M1341_00925 [Candidatus Thermoplasmatota archaeon]|nr:hypothetical protein [Candidatus Thermoplasmatota archaeon]
MRWSVVGLFMFLYIVSLIVLAWGLSADFPILPFPIEPGAYFVAAIFLSFVMGLALVPYIQYLVGISSFLLILAEFALGNASLTLIPFFTFLVFLASAADRQNPKIIIDKSTPSHRDQPSQNAPNPVPPPPPPNTVQQAPAASTMAANEPPKVSSSVALEDTFALVGPPTSGKTTLLAYFMKFLPEITSEINVGYEIKSGYEVLEEYLQRIIREQKFPAGTARGAISSVIIKFISKKRIGHKVSYLQVTDMSGELFNSLKGDGTSVRKMLMGSSYEFLLRVKGYLFMVDCSTYQTWTTEDIVYTRILNALAEARNEKKKLPLAFVFTKSDLLPEAVFDYSAEDLLKSLGSTSKFAREHYENPTAFKIFIKTKRNESGEIVPNVDEVAGGMRQIVYDKVLNNGFEQMAYWVCRIGEVIK